MIKQETVTPDKRRARSNTPWYWDGPILMRKCTVCQEVKATDAYDKSKTKSGRGIRNTCKECRSKWREENKEFLSAYAKKYWKANSESMSEKRKEYGRKYYLKNKKEILEKQSRYKRKRPEKRRLWEGRRRAQKKSNGVFIVLDKDLRKLLSNPCFICGAKERIVIDHSVPIARGGRHSIGNFLPLCQPCNLTKHTKLLCEIRYR
jgi:hypothetical protein